MSDLRWCILCEKLIDLDECQFSCAPSGSCLKTTRARTTAIKDGIPHILLSRWRSRKFKAKAQEQQQ